MSFLALLSALALVSAAPAAGDNIGFKERDLPKIIKGVRKYYGFVEEDRPGKAHDELQKLEELILGSAKGTPLAEILSWTEAWRDILRQANLPEKNKLVLRAGTAKIVKKPNVSIENPFGFSGEDLKLLGKKYDGNLKIFASAPKDYKKRLFPVILALHPTEEENSVPFKQLTDAKTLTERVFEWASLTYDKAVFESAIIVIPILDAATVNSDKTTATRAGWTSDLGTATALVALRHVVLTGTPHDPARIYLDGDGAGAPAAMVLCEQFPGTMAGAIIRGHTAERIQFGNCEHQSFLFEGKEGGEFVEAWKEKGDFHLTHVDELDSNTLTSWVESENTRKDSVPSKVHVRSTSMSTANAYWLMVTDIDRTIEDINSIDIMAEVNRDENTITVTSNKLVKGFGIFTNDDLLDLDKEITIIHKMAGAEDDEGRICFQGTQRRELKDLLDLYYLLPHGNVGEVFAGKIEVEL